MDEKISYKICCGYEDLFEVTNKNMWGARGPLINVIVTFDVNLTSKEILLSVCIEA